MWNRYVIRRKINSFSRRMSWRWAPMKPIRAWIIATNRCNLKCRHCPAHCPDWDVPPEKFEDMRPEVYERVKREIFPGLEEVYFSGGGEPFLAPVFYEMLDDLFRAGKRCWIITNGTIQKPEWIDRLVKTPSLLIVSIDGTTNEVMKRIRGVSLDRVLDFVQMAKEIRDRASHPGFQLNINWVVTRSNLEQMVEAVELARRYGVVTLSFTNFEKFGRADEFALTESLTDRPDLVLPHWNRARDLAAKHGINVPDIYFDCPQKPEEERQEHQPTIYESNGRIRQCPHPWWSVHVNTDGMIKPCCIYPDGVTMGNLAGQSFREIWNGRKYQHLRRTVNTPNMPDICRRCFIPARF